MAALVAEFADDVRWERTSRIIIIRTALGNFALQFWVPTIVQIYGNTEMIQGEAFSLERSVHSTFFFDHNRPILCSSYTRHLSCSQPSLPPLLYSTIVGTLASDVPLA